ncbi:MAG: M20 family metallopeptidase, partial [Acidobacteria bacterium]|nr:M20 family metallopeptidase [Acidobacteriota bacterium]
MPTPLLRYCRDHDAWLLDRIHQLVRIESPTDDPAAVNACGTVLVSELRSLGASVSTLAPDGPAGDHLIARFGEGPRRILLLGHFDTVWPVGQLARMPIRTDNGRLYGPGVLDMKAGIAIGMLAVRAWQAASATTDVSITMLWSTDEETGSRTSRALIEAEARASEAVLVLEPALAGGALKTARKGVGQYEITAHGVSAHAGVDPRKGVNAIRELALQVLALDGLRDLDRGISLNVGVITGGTRSNVVPDRASASVDVRAETLADAERLDHTMRALSALTAGARLEVTGGFNRPPMERSPGVIRLFELAKAAAAEMGLALEEGATGGGSDGNFT